MQEHHPRWAVAELQRADRTRLDALDAGDRVDTGLPGVLAYGTTEAEAKARVRALALRVVAEAAYRAGAPEGLFGCLTEVTLEGTDALLEDPLTDVILARA